MSNALSRRDALVPLSDRIRWTAVFRLGIGAAPMVIWHLQSTPPLVAWSTLAVPALAYMVLGVASFGFHRVRRQTALFGLMAGLLIDGVYLAWVFYALGGLGSGVEFYVVVHVAGVTLLSSFRSGLKVALWHSLLAIAVLEAKAVQLFSSAPGARTPFPTREFSVYLIAIWITALVTATFAAVNERELRRRRYDVEVLRSFASELETCYDPVRVMELLAELGREELLASRVAVVLESDEAAREAFDGSSRKPDADGTDIVVVIDDDGQRIVPAPATLHRESLVRRALRSHGPVLTTKIGGPDADWLGVLLPGAANLACTPFTVAERRFGALILEYGPSGGRRPRRIERRLLATAEQAVAQAALAVGRAMLMQRLRDAAETDGLTGIANRRSFDDALSRECRRSARTGEPLAIALIDLDHFKVLNDEQGHLAGDDALREVAEIIKGVGRATDLPARYGGEEFAVLIVGADAEQATHAAERMRSAIEASPEVEVTASVGVAACPEHGIDERALLAAADKALYTAKREGRNRVVVAGDQSGSDLPASVPG